MSGIVGIVNLRCAPIDCTVLERMTRFLANRGPDSQAIWVEGHIGFGHAMLRTTDEAQHEQQPFSLDGEVWIVADARVDGRQELIRLLRSVGHTVTNGATDVELILRAYSAWGEDCLEHLIGDFCFGIWDPRRQRLFCARDQLGVKPFFYASGAEWLIFSNTLDCIRLDPRVSDSLDEEVIANFLLNSDDGNPEATVFCDIRRLPRAHALTWGGDVLSTRCYWTLRQPEIIRYKRRREYIEHFNDLWRTAVADRLRTNRVAVAMSGGLDSTAVAATARMLLAERDADFDLRAHALVYEHVIPHHERYYSGIAAEALRIPVDYLVADRYGPFERWDQPGWGRPEPQHTPEHAVFHDLCIRLAAHSRVALTGYDGDTFLNEPPKPYFHALLRQFRFANLLRAMVTFSWSTGKLPPMGLRTLVKRLRGTYSHKPQYPVWLSQAFSARLNLPYRFAQINAERASAAGLRGRPFATLSSLSWSECFESHDAGVTRLPLEFRHPVIDIRLIRYALSLPIVPWLLEKHVLREAMRGVLPEAVRCRPKSPLAGDPVTLALGKCETHWVDRFVADPRLSAYVDRAAVPKVAGDTDVQRVWMNLRPFSLNCWLQDYRRVVKVH